LNEESSLKYETSFEDKDSWFQENKVLFEQNIIEEKMFNLNPLTPKEIA